MKLKLLLLTFILVCTGCKNDPRIQAAYDLIERVTPGYGKQFKLELMEPIDGMDAREIPRPAGGKSRLREITISLATAFSNVDTSIMHVFPGSAINWTCRSNCPCPSPLKTRSTANTVSI